jgi:hypothetical protein
MYRSALNTYGEIHEKVTRSPHDYSAIFVVCYLCGKEGHIAVNCQEHFLSIKGNLLSQIQQIKMKIHHNDVGGGAHTQGEN